MENGQCSGGIRRPGVAATSTYRRGPNERTARLGGEEIVSCQAGRSLNTRKDSQPSYALDAD